MAKPPRPVRPLPPALQARAAAVKAAHATLQQTRPDWARLTPAARFAATQAYVRGQTKP